MSSLLGTYPASRRRIKPDPLPRTSRIPSASCVLTLESSWLCCSDSGWTWAGPGPFSFGSQRWPQTTPSPPPRQIRCQLQARARSSLASREAAAGDEGPEPIAVADRPLRGIAGGSSLAQASEDGSPMGRRQLDRRRVPPGRTPKVLTLGPAGQVGAWEVSNVTSSGCPVCGTT